MLRFGTLVSLILAFTATIALADQRLALVIETTSPSESTIATGLEASGYSVTMLKDADLAAMKQGIASFAATLREAKDVSTAMIYYQGDGVQAFGQNFLLPAKAAITDPADLYFAALDVQSVARQLLSGTAETNLLVLDCCIGGASEPLEPEAQGLVHMPAEDRLVLLFASTPGTWGSAPKAGVASFGEVFLSTLGQPGVSVIGAMEAITAGVASATGGAQVPWYVSGANAAAVLSEDPVAAEELAEWLRAKASNDPIQLIFFLENNPDSAYVPDAKLRLAELVDIEVAAPQKPGVTGGAETELTVGELTRSVSPQPTRNDPTAVFFGQPLATGAPGIAGKSIAELIKGSPLYPPVEGLPESYWKAEACSNCHQWSQANLCDQATYYTRDTGTGNQEKQHPYGGSFKQNLRIWAQGGCK